MLRTFAMILLSIVIACPATAAGWGDLVRGECRSSEGKREYKAKIWTVPIKDKDPMTECSRTRKTVSGKNRTPNRCDDYGAGIVYGVWYVPDSACGVAPLPSPVTDKTRNITSQIIDDPFAPKVTVRKISEARKSLMRQFMVSTGLARPVDDLVLKMTEAWNTLAEKNEVAAFTESAILLQSELLSDHPDAIAVREVWLTGDNQQIYMALSKLPSFQNLEDEVEASALINAVSISVAGDLQYYLGANADFTFIIGWLESTETMGTMVGADTGVTLGYSTGPDIGITIGIWTSPLDNISGNAQGFTGAFSRNEIGYNLSVFFSYPDNCRFMYRDPKELFEKLLGFTIGMQTPTSVEAEYARTRLWTAGKAIPVNDWLNPVDVEFGAFDACLFRR